CLRANVAGRVVDKGARRLLQTVAVRPCNGKLVFVNFVQVTAAVNPKVARCVGARGARCQLDLDLVGFGDGQHAGTADRGDLNADDLGVDILGGIEASILIPKDSNVASAVRLRHRIEHAAADRYRAGARVERVDPQQLVTNLEMGANDDLV